MNPKSKFSSADFVVEEKKEEDNGVLGINFNDQELNSLKGYPSHFIENNQNPKKRNSIQTPPGKEEPNDLNADEDSKNMEFIDAVKNYLNVSISKRTFYVNVLLILSVSVSLYRSQICDLYEAINTQLHLSTSEMVGDPIIDDLQLDTISTMFSAWNKMKTLMNNLVLSPEGNLYSIHDAIACTDEINSGDGIFLASFNQVQGVILKIETFDDELYEAFFPGLYTQERIELLQEMEENVSNPNNVREIDIYLSAYNDYLGVIGMFEMKFEYKGVGELVSKLEFLAINPFGFSGKDSIDWAFIFTFIMVVITIINTIIDLVINTVVFINKIAITMKTKTFSIPV